MNHAVRLLISFLFSLSAYATCPDAPTSTLECRGAKLVTNQSELDAYLQNFAENTTKGFIRGVRLRGNFSGTSQNIASPCKIIIDEASTLNFSEELCLISKDKVIARRGLNLFGKDVTLKAPNRVIIQDNATIDLSGDLTLHSHGPTEESRAHIRHSANVKVNNLTLRGLYRSTLGKESTYEAQGKISVFSTGEERPTDEDISEWSTVWGDTTIQANEFEARALWRVKVGTRTAINASKITLDGQGCKIGRDATLTALEKQGRCLLPNRPVARFKISPKEASIGESILLDGSRSQNAAAGESFRWRIDMPNGERIDTRKVEGPTYEFTPTQAGEHTIELRVYDQDGFHDWKKKKLIVRGSELFSYYKFELEEEKLSLIYEGRALSDERSIVEAFYTAPDGNRIDVGRRVLGHVDVIDSFDATEPVDLKLTVVDDLGTREEFTHTIEPRAEFQRPVLNFETIEYAPNELVFFSNFMFDPYNQLSDFDGFTLDFGDESSVEINAESFSTTHLYSSEGQYPAKIYAGNYENQKEVTVTGSPSSFEFPLADFKVDGASWAPGVRLYVDQTISPTSPIQSYLWRLGDGTTAYGPEVLHFYNEGAYDVSLTVVLDNGTSSTVTREVIIMQTAPNLVGTVDCYDIGDKKAECHVEALDILSDLKTLNINFGDNPQSIESTTVSGQWAEHTFIHSYEETGNYTVTMQALTNRGEEFFTTTEVAIGENPSNLPPVAILGCYPVYQDVICYSDSSYDPDGYITNYEYDFGDGTVINTTDTEVFHRFENTGTFTINLTVTDNFGVTASYPETVVIEEKPNEFPVPQLSCVSTAPQSLTCEGRNSYDPDGSITMGRLTAVETGEVFETNDLSALQKTFIFSSGGLKTIVLEVTDNQGAVVPLQKDFETMVNVPPIVSFYCTSSSIGILSCDGSNSTLGNAPSFVSFNWVINEKSYSGDTVEVTGLTEDQASVSLTVVDSLGQSTSKTDIYEVVQNDLPVGDFNCTSPSPQQLNCLANYSDSDGEVVSYTWSVEGEQFSGNYFETTLDRGGEVSVSLSVKDDFGSEVFQNKSVQVIENQAPVAIIKVDRNGKIAPATFSLSAEDSYDNDGSIVSYEWKLPSGESKTGVNISLAIDEVGETYIELLVKDNFDVVSSMEIKLITVEGKEFIISHSKDGDMIPLSIDISVLPNNGLVDDYTYEWFINEERLENSEAEISYSELQNSTTIVNLVATDIFGNKYFATKEIKHEVPDSFFEINSGSLEKAVGEEILLSFNGISFIEEDRAYDIEITDVGQHSVVNTAHDTLAIKSFNEGTFSIVIRKTTDNSSFERTVEYSFYDFIDEESFNLANGGGINLKHKDNNISQMHLSTAANVNTSYVELDGKVLFKINIVTDEDPVVLIWSDFSELIDIEFQDIVFDTIGGNDSVSGPLNVKAYGLTELRKNIPEESDVSIYLKLRDEFNINNNERISVIGPNGQEFIIHESAKGSFGINGDQEFKVASNNYLISYLDEIIFKASYSSFPIEIYSPTWAGEKSPLIEGLAPDGTSKIFLNVEYLKEEVNNDNKVKTLHKIIHENIHHENDFNKVYSDIRDDLTFPKAHSYTAFEENYTEMKTLMRLESIFSQTGFFGFNPYLTYDPLRNKGSFEEGFKDHFLTGLIKSGSKSRYQNELHFTIINNGIGFSRYRDEMVSSLSGNNWTIRNASSYSKLSENTISFLSAIMAGQIFQAVDLKNISFKFDEVTSVGPSGFGIIRVPYTEIEKYYQIMPEFEPFRLKIEGYEPSTSPLKFSHIPIKIEGGEDSGYFLEFPKVLLENGRDIYIAAVNTNGNGSYPIVIKSEKFCVHKDLKRDGEKGCRFVPRVASDILQRFSYEGSPIEGVYKRKDGWTIPYGVYYDGSCSSEYESYGSAKYEYYCGNNIKEIIVPEYASQKCRGAGEPKVTTYGITNVKASCFGYESEKVPDPNVEDFLFSAYYGL